jgi:uncharacterized protein YutE (UPF0331/DUF86 family)
MVSIEKISRKFVQLEEYLEILNRIGKRSEKDFLDDKILIGSAKYYLQVSIECCLDVANHIIASEKCRPPRDYADTFVVTAEAGIIDKGLSQRLRQMAKFKNRLVHLYAEIDNKSVYAYIKEDLKDIRAFRNIIIERYL